MAGTSIGLYESCRLGGPCFVENCRAMGILS